MCLFEPFVPTEVWAFALCPDKKIPLKTPGQIFKLLEVLKRSPERFKEEA